MARIPLSGLWPTLRPPHLIKSCCMNKMPLLSSQAPLQAMVFSEQCPFYLQNKAWKSNHIHTKSWNLFIHPFHNLKRVKLGYEWLIRSQRKLRMSCLIHDILYSWLIYFSEKGFHVVIVATNEKTSHIGSHLVNVPTNEKTPHMLGKMFPCGQCPTNEKTSHKLVKRDPKWSMYQPMIRHHISLAQCNSTVCTTYCSVRPTPKWNIKPSH